MLVDLLCALGRDGRLTVQAAQEIVNAADKRKYKDVAELLRYAYSRLQTAKTGTQPVRRGTKAKNTDTTRPRPRRVVERSEKWLSGTVFKLYEGDSYPCQFAEKARVGFKLNTHDEEAWQLRRIWGRRG